MIGEALPYLRAFIPVLSFFVIGAAGTWLAISAWEGVAALYHKHSKRHRFIALSCSTSRLRRAVTELKDDPMMRYLTMGQGLAIGDKLDMLASLATLYNSLRNLGIACPQIELDFFESPDAHIEFLMIMEILMRSDNYGKARSFSFGQGKPGLLRKSDTAPPPVSPRGNDNRAG